jgi:hypothetical protein
MFTNELLGSPIEPEEAKDRRWRKANLPLLNAKLIRLSRGCRPTAQPLRSGFPLDQSARVQATRRHPCLASLPRLPAAVRPELGARGEVGRVSRYSPAKTESMVTERGLRSAPGMERNMPHEYFNRLIRKARKRHRAF